MARQEEPAGLLPRIKAAQRLRDVLSGSAFQPFSTSEIAGGADRALANRLVNTALRRTGHIGIALDALLERGLPKKSGSFEAVLRISLAQLLFLPDLGAHSAVFLAVEALKRDPKARHLQGLMNAVLRRAQAEAARFWDLEPALLFPDWLRIRWSAIYGSEALDGFGESLLGGAPLDLSLRDDDAGAREALGGEVLFGRSVRIAERDRPVEQMPSFAEGAWWVQDVAAAVPAQLLRLAPNARVLDLCAAPGGKTAQLAAAGYRVTALDVDEMRLERVRENLGRLRLDAEIVCADGSSYSSSAPFDAVLLDAPCSATGIFRRHPEVLLIRTEKDIADRVRLQQRLIRTAARLLVPGGILVYCVCSLEPEEGEDQAAWIRENLPGLVADPFEADELQGLAEALRADGTLRLYPGLATRAPLRGEMDGFFVARFARLRA